MKLHKQFIDDLATLIGGYGLPSELNLEDRVIAEYLCDNIITLSKVKSVEIKGEDDTQEFIDYIYNLYPSKCPMRNTSLGKSRKDKDRIKKLLKVYTREEIERVVKEEISQKLGKQYMQNFSTFLNNFPDPNTIEGGDLFGGVDVGKGESKSSTSVVIDGVHYR